MGLSEFSKNIRYYLDHQPPSRAVQSIFGELLAGVARRVGPALPTRGVNFYDREWDVLIILDTCRVDALQEVAPEYDFLPSEIDSTRSVGSKTVEWMQKTFTPAYRDEMARTAYVTFNPNSEEELDPSWFQHLDEVWRTDWNAAEGGVPPRPVTDRAIAAHRELSPDRLMVHYKQPHTPYPQFEKLDPVNEVDDDANDRSGPFGALIEGRVTREELWGAYLDDLRLALDDIALLLESLDADRVVITADHGECFGEWGLYGHHGWVPAPELVSVPWVVTSAENTADYEPETDLNATVDQEDVDDKLRALGYKA
ncbi:hypothetical protein [Natrinema halophilum]|uniref:hypothetical protein n=1 Tax=Natrinema halophilum TaxID=1699371 RepID=UPI001C5322FD|nr:hypothetical protein [Natrinema halophilum]QLG51173.2 hypothetical protein HYG82_08515 [Natrinema halophilum]